MKDKLCKEFQDSGSIKMQKYNDHNHVDHVTLKSNAVSLFDHRDSINCSLLRMLLVNHDL
jgi:hypothetical protein